MNLLTLLTPNKAAALKQDVNGSLTAINNMLQAGGTTIVTSVTPVALTVDSSQQQWFSGSTNQDVYLPDATTLYNTFEFLFVNNSSANIVVYADDQSTVIETIGPDDIYLFKLSSNATSNGTWETAVLSTGIIPTSQNVGWTPTDGSGAALTFTGVSASYSRISNFFTSSLELTYPITADTSPASIDGFISEPSDNFVGLVGKASNGIVILGNMLTGTSEMFLEDISGTSLTNADLSGLTLTFNNITYAI